MTAIKCIAIDVDGTLLNSQGHLPPRTAAAVCGAARYVTASNDEDGVAAAIDRFVLHSAAAP